MFESFNSRDSVGNATAETWIVNVDFISDAHRTYEQGSGRFVGFSATAKNAPLPMVTNIMVRAANSFGKAYSLHNYELLKLRRESGGTLKFVIYDEGLACLPTAPHPRPEDFPNTPEEYLELLQRKKAAGLKWTHDVLAK